MTTVSSNSYALLFMKIVMEDEIIEHGYIKISNRKIAELGHMEQYSNPEKLEEVHIHKELLAVPGFIDIHIHGLNGADVMDATEEALISMATTLPKEGTTGFLATTLTQDKSLISTALQNIHAYMEKQTNNGSPSCELLGVHLEGPFINVKRAGAQPTPFILEPNVPIFEQFQSDSGNNIRIVTMAPELTEGIVLVEFLTKSGVITSIGHSDALYSEMLEAMKAGAEHITHFYNGMRGNHHREPGVAGTGLAHPELFLEMIADGIHVHPAVVKATYLAKGADGMLLITDSMRAKWLKNGEYDLAGQKVKVQNKSALLEDGTIAGSVLKMNEAVKNMMDYTGCSMNHAVQMASSNPAKRLNVWDRKGSIAVGKDADIVIVDDEMQVKMTFCNGQLSYKGE
ncbi:N-acetylglucosamine-6-phosphate deacetylase [Bacillus sp. LL01]|uniref:N-acetylglucosamine-6-phosphate deacetylase n=1 Tax=Bacillus sp. LL01 TaxID=1665556 RepID=UPI00064D31A2|nr:N-acetylglucosamine-6-phosphate deacetylase [Bacillus sp. LL01]KMJ58417.1 N-acetylglucosamine-6-phosphate deacetylase [Bacillus sp. LL01]